MEKVLRNIFSSIFIIVLIAASLQAQFIIKQIDYEIPISYELIPEDVDFDSQEEETLFFMTVPLEKIKKAALQEGKVINTMESFVYLDGDNYAFESDTEMGKMTVISNAKDGRMYMVRWVQKTVVVITPDDFKGLEDKANAAMEESLKNLTPEMRAQIKAAMEEENTEKAEGVYTVEKTGKKSTINNFDCELYLQQQEEGMATGIWASKDNLRIVSEIEDVSEKFSKIFNMGEEEETDEWALVPGMIPVEVREMHMDSYMGQPGFSISLIDKIEKTPPPADKFRVPSEQEGFKHITFSDMMNKMYGN